MNVTEIKLDHGPRVFILENVFDQATLAYVHELSRTFDKNNPLWNRAGTSEDYPRWEYNVHDVSFAPVKNYFAQGPHLLYWQNKLAPDQPNRLFVSNITFFIDLPGSPPLLAHVEGSSSWLSQVYISNQTHAYNGTTIYNNDKQILFQLPFRDNFGWCFDNGSTVMHGREHGVPEGLTRFGLMIWYALLPQN